MDEGPSVDAEGVDVFEGGGELGAEVGDDGGWEGSGGEELADGGSGDELHGDTPAALEGVDAVDADDVGVLELGAESGLVEEVGAQVEQELGHGGMIAAGRPGCDRAGTDRRPGTTGQSQESNLPLTWPGCCPASDT